MPLFISLTYNSYTIIINFNAHYNADINTQPLSSYSYGGIAVGNDAGATPSQNIGIKVPDTQ